MYFFNPKSFAETITCPPEYYQLSCAQFTWDDHIFNNNPTCEYLYVEDDYTVYWRLATDPATGGVYNAGKVITGPIDFGGIKFIKSLSVGLARPIFMYENTSVDLKICASDTLGTDHVLGNEAKCANYIPSKEQISDNLVTPIPEAYYSMQPTGDTVTGRFATLEFTLRSSDPKVTPMIGPNNMRLNFISVLEDE